MVNAMAEQHPRPTPPPDAAKRRANRRLAIALAALAAAFYLGFILMQAIDS